MRAKAISRLFLIVTVIFVCASVFSGCLKVPRLAKQVYSKSEEGVSATIIDSDFSKLGNESITVRFKNEGKAPVSYFSIFDINVFRANDGSWSNVIKGCIYEVHDRTYTLEAGEELTQKYSLDFYDVSVNDLYKICLPMGCTVYFDVYLGWR